MRRSGTSCRDSRGSRRSASSAAPGRPWQVKTSVRRHTGKCAWTRSKRSRRRRRPAARKNSQSRRCRRWMRVATRCTLTPPGGSASTTLANTCTSWRAASRRASSTTQRLMPWTVSKLQVTRAIFTRRAPRSQRAEDLQIALVLLGAGDREEQVAAEHQTARNEDVPRLEGGVDLLLGGGRLDQDEVGLARHIV